MRPRAILIEDDPLDAEIERLTLSRVGFDVAQAGSIIDGETQIMTLLSLETTAVPTVIILDLHMPSPGHPELEGAILAAVLTRRIHEQLIHPARIVALTNHLNPDREEEALYAGCEHVLTKPLTNSHAAWLLQWVDHAEHVPAPAHDPGVRLYQKKAEEILGILRRGQPLRTWTAHDTHVLLSALTSYPAPPSTNADQQTALLLTLGGREAAIATLQICAKQIDAPYNIILADYLDGKNRRLAHKHLMNAGYSRTYSYYCINELPARVSAWLRLHGGDQRAVGISS